MADEDIALLLDMKNADASEDESDGSADEDNEVLVVEIIIIGEKFWGSERKFYGVVGTLPTEGIFADTRARLLRTEKADDVNSDQHLDKAIQELAEVQKATKMETRASMDGYL